MAETAAAAALPPSQEDDKKKNTKEIEEKPPTPLGTWMWCKAKVVEQWQGAVAAVAIFVLAATFGEFTDWYRLFPWGFSREYRQALFERDSNKARADNLGSQLRDATAETERVRTSANAETERVCSEARVATAQAQARIIELNTEIVRLSGEIWSAPLGPDRWPSKD